MRPTRKAVFVKKNFLFNTVCRATTVVCELSHAWNVKYSSTSPVVLHRIKKKCILGMFVASSHNKTEIKQIELGLQKNLIEFRHCHEVNEVKISHDL